MDIQRDQRNRARRRATRRDLPALCLLYAVIFALGALGLPFASSLDMASLSDLHPILGSVRDAPRVTVSGKAEQKLHILVLASDGVHDLTQDDLSGDVPAILNLKAGDDIIAYVRHDLLGRNLDWLWALKRGSVTILSYDDTYRYLQRENARVRQIASWSGGLSLGLFVIAAVLRNHFGAWRDSVHSAACQEKNQQSL